MRTCLGAMVFGDVASAWGALNCWQVCAGNRFRIRKYLLARDSEIALNCLHPIHTYQTLDQQTHWPVISPAVALHELPAKGGDGEAEPGDVVGAAALTQLNVVQVHPGERENSYKLARISKKLTRTRTWQNFCRAPALVSPRVRP